MITENKNESAAPTFTVRVFLRSKTNPNIRITRQKKGFRSRAEAEREEQKLHKECERKIISLESRGVLFCDLLDEWYHYEMGVKVTPGLRSQQIHDDYLSSVKLWFGDFLKRPAMDLNAFEVTRIFEEIRTKGRCHNHRKKLRTILRTIFDFGIQSGRLPRLQRNPALEVVLKKEVHKKPEILTLREIQLLTQKAFEEQHPWRRVWAVALMTGLRSGELYALSWEDVDWDNKLISVSRSYNGRMREFKSTKAGYWRQVPISPELEAILIEQRQVTGESQYIFERNWEWDKGLQAKILRKFCFVHGLSSIKFHTLRACFATQMLRQGVEVARVMKICGWKELKTMQHYVRLAGIEIEGATDGLKIFPGPTLTSKKLSGETAA